MNSKRYLTQSEIDLYLKVYRGEEMEGIKWSNEINEYTIKVNSLGLEIEGELRLYEEKNKGLYIITIKICKEYYYNIIAKNKEYKDMVELMERIEEDIIKEPNFYKKIEFFKQSEVEEEWDRLSKNMVSRKGYN